MDPLAAQEAYIPCVYLLDLPTNPRFLWGQVFNRVRDGNFSLEGIAQGWDLKDKTVGRLNTFHWAAHA